MDLKVFITTGESVCSECGEELGHHAWITLDEGKGALCLRVPIWITSSFFHLEMLR